MDLKGQEKAAKCHTIFIIKLPLPAFDAKFVTSISKLADACKAHEITINAILLIHSYKKNAEYFMNEI